METFQITCINTEPIEFEDVEEPSPQCLFELDYNFGSMQVLKSSLFQPYGARYGPEIAVKPEGEIVRVYVLKGKEYVPTQWAVSGFIRFDMGYQSGVEFANRTLSLRSGIDHDLFLNPNGILSKLGMQTIAQYAFIYGALKTTRYVFQGFPSIIALKDIIIEKMRLFVTNIRFQANLDSDTTLFDFVDLNRDLLEFKASEQQPLTSEPLEAVMVRLYGHSLYIGNNVIIMYEGVSDYNYGVLSSRLMHSDSLPGVFLDLVQQPTLFRLGMAAGLAFRDEELPRLPSISTIELTAGFSGG